MAKLRPYLFVYGTLREDVGHEMYHVLARNASFLGEATVVGTLYDLGQYPGLVPDDGTKETVTGELYRIQEAILDHTFEILDDYEGVGPNDPMPHEYKREIIPVSLNDGRRLDAWAYVLNLSPEGLRKISSGDYREFRRIPRTRRKPQLTKAGEAVPESNFTDNSTSGVCGRSCLPVRGDLYRLVALRPRNHF
jgi:gamma-glutamylcyclotransferase (GGCT)/AIG2-like uncharacterized protein YtfP